MSGYAPFMETVDYFGPLILPSLKFIGNNLGAPGDILYSDIIASEPRKEIIRTIFAHLKATTHPFRRWELGYIPSRSLTSACAEQVFVTHESLAFFQSSRPYVRMELPLHWDAYVKALKSKPGSQFRSGLRKLSEFGEVRVCMDQEPKKVSQRIIEIIRNHDQWFKGTPRERWFGGQPVRRFYISAAELLAGQGKYLTFTLELEGTPIAWEAGAFDGNRFFGQLTSFDRSFETHRPGFLLMVLRVRHLLSLGIRHLELGPGFSHFKSVLGGTPIPYVRVNGYPCAPGWFYRLVQVGSIPKITKFAMDWLSGSTFS